MKDINQHRITFYKFLNDDISKESFEHWVYENKELEQLFQPDHYVDLLSFNYKSSGTKSYIKSVVKKNFDWQEFEKWRTIRLLGKIKNGEIEIVLASRRLRELYLEQEREIENPLVSVGLAIGYESVLDNCPIESEYHLWDSDALQRQLKQVEWYQHDFLNDVENELISLMGT